MFKIFLDTITAVVLGLLVALLPRTMFSRARTAEDLQTRNRQWLADRGRL